MKQIQLRFIRTNSFIGKIIRWITWSEWNHVDLVINDEEAFGASGKIGRVDTYPRDPESHDKIAIVTIKVPKGKYEKFMTEILSKGGTLYDYKGIKAFLIKFNIQEDDKWFCSELLIHAFYVAEIIYFTDPSHKWSPDHMWKAISFCSYCEIEYVK